MSRLRIASRLAVHDLRASKAVTAVVVLLLVLPIGLLLEAVLVGFWLSASSRLALLAAPLVAVLVRSVLATRRRTSSRRAALLAVNGARPADLLAVELAEALVLVLGATLVALAIVAVDLHGLFRERSTIEIVRLLAQAAGLVGGMLLAVVAVSLVPGRRALRPGATRIDLAGGRPSATIQPRAFVAAAAAYLVGFGAWWVASGLADRRGEVLLGAGTLVVAAGVGMTGSCALGLLERASRRGPAAWRATARTMARQRYRTAPLLALATIVVIAAVIAGTGYTSLQAAKAGRLDVLHGLDVRTVPDGVVAVGDAAGSIDVPPAVVDQVHDIVGTTPVPVPIVGTYGRGPRLTSWDERTGAAGPLQIGVATPDVLRVLGLGQFREDLDAGRVLVLDPLAAATGRGAATSVRLRVPDGATLDVDGVVVWPGRLHTVLPAVLVPDGFAQRHELRPVATMVLFEIPADRSVAVADALGRVGVDEVTGGTPDGGSFTLGAPPDERMVLFEGHQLAIAVPGPAREWMAAQESVDLVVPVAVYGDNSWFFLLLALVVMTITLALAVLLGVHQRRRDDELLAVQGAPARARRSRTAIEAAALTALAGTIASVVGAASTAMAIWWTNGVASTYPHPQVPFAQPWVLTLLLTVGVPVVFATVAYAVTPGIRRVDLARLGADG